MKKRNTGLAFLGRVSRAFSLFLFFLLLCGVASAEVVYSVASKDFSLENVTYDSAGAPQTGTLVEGIKASGVELTGTFSTAQGDWRVLADISSMDTVITSDPNYVSAGDPIHLTAIDSHSYSLYGLDKAQTAPLATSQKFTKFTKPWRVGSESHLTSSALYVLSQDFSPYEILKLSLDTLETSKTKSVKGDPQWDYLEDKGVIYYWDDSSSTPSLILLDADLNDTTVVLNGNYSYDYSLTDLDDTSFALAFTSYDVQTVTDPESGKSYPHEVTTDLGILKVSGSTSSVIVKAENVGFKKDTGNWSIGNMVKDRKGGLYFLVNTGVGSNDVYHWDGSATTSIYEGKRGEDVQLLISDSAGNLYFSTRKYDDEEGKWKTKVYRGGTVVLEVKNSSYIYFGKSKTGKDNSGNVYFVGVPYENAPGKQSYTLYRCGASDTKATELTSVNGDELEFPSNISDADFYFSAIKANHENNQLILSYTYFHYNGTEVKQIHAFENVSDAVDLPGDDMKHKTLYLYSTSQDVTAGTTTSTVLAFDNTDRHNPVKLKEFKVAGKISDVALYNDKVEPSPVVPIKPTTYTTTPKIEEKYVSQAPASGWTSFPITGIVDANGTPSPAKTVFYIWINIISRLSVAANLADDEWGPYLLESEEEGKLELDISKLKNLDGTPVTDFPGGDCIITYSTTLDGKGGFSGKTEQQVKVAKSSSSSGGGGSSGGCDAGFGALALAVLAAGVLLKKHSK